MDMGGVLGVVRVGTEQSTKGSGERMAVFGSGTWGAEPGDQGLCEYIL
jgi:hypothetical protein